MDRVKGSKNVHKNKYFMKKLAILVGAASILACTLIFQSYTPAPPTGTGCVGGNYYVNSLVYPIYYGAPDTLKGAQNDTIKMSCGCKPTSIVFNNDLYLASVVVPTVTPTVGAALYVSSDGGATYATTPVTTYTVSAITSYTVAATDATANVTNQYLVNSPYGGNPYTNYMWVLYGKASDTVAIVGSVTVR